jgi:hypothetical protein
MPIEVHGLNETLGALRKVEPVLYKKIRNDLVGGAKDLTTAVGKDFPNKPLEHWHSSGERRGKARMPPYSPNGAQRGVKAKVLTSRKKSGILRIEQSNAGGQVYDAAGGDTAGRFVKNLDKHLSTKSKPPRNRSRVMYGSVAGNLHLVEDRIRAVIKDTEKYIQAQIVRGV